MRFFYGEQERENKGLIEIRYLRLNTSDSYFHLKIFMRLIRISLRNLTSKRLSFKCKLAFSDKILKGKDLILNLSGIVPSFKQLGQKLEIFDMIHRLRAAS